MAPSRNIVVAGAGIGGLTTALSLAQRGFRVVLLDQAKRLEETGAGIQLSPNATHILIGLGLKDRLAADAVEPAGISIHSSRGGTLARIPLGAYAEQRYHAPYWVTHRADLQAALLEAARASPDIDVRLGTQAEDFVLHAHGITVGCRRGTDPDDQAGIGLVCADGLWSRLRLRLGHREKPVFSRRVAWRALVPAQSVEPVLRSDNLVHLWLGDSAHLVHYPVKLGTLINIVAIVDDDGWSAPGWSEPGKREDIVSRFSSWRWGDQARGVVATPQSWQKWALHELPPIKQWGDGPVTLVGDAAHPMLPFLAQGAAMAIEDGAVLAASLAQTPEDIPGAMRRYERARRKRTLKAQRGARRNSNAYHLSGSEAFVRNLYLRAIGGKMLLRGYDWLYDWRPSPPKK